MAPDEIAAVMLLDLGNRRDSTRSVDQVVVKGAASTWLHSASKQYIDPTQIAYVLCLCLACRLSLCTPNLHQTRKWRPQVGVQCHSYDRNHIRVHRGRSCSSPSLRSVPFLARVLVEGVYLQTQLPLMGRRWVYQQPRTPKVSIKVLLSTCSWLVSLGDWATASAKRAIKCQLIPLMSILYGRTRAPASDGVPPHRCIMHQGQAWLQCRSPERIMAQQCTVL